MGGIASTQHAKLKAQNWFNDNDLAPKTAEGCHVTAKKVQGSHVFEISGYSLHRKRLKDDRNYVTSAVFAVGGFDWQIGFTTGIVHGRDEGCVGACLDLKSEEDQDTRVRASFHLSLVDVTGSMPPHTMIGANEFDPEPERSASSGCLYFMEKSELEASPYLHDDRLTIECVINIESVITIDKGVKSFADVTPSDITDITEDLGKLLQGEEDTDVVFEAECVIDIESVITVDKGVKSFADDVTPSSDITEHLGKLLLQGEEDIDVVFEVEGEVFPAHRRMLAMRSPVFKAELHGSMRENDMNQITILEMQPVVFEALLHFIYTGSLPAMDDLGRTDYQETIRHLLVAADRYAIDTLKIMCESILCDNIDLKTVLTTLALADQHHCCRLNDACLQFIASLGRVQIEDVMASQEYAELKANHPLALVELWEKICSLGRSKSSVNLGSLVA